MKVPLDTIDLDRALLRRELDPEQLRSLAEDLLANGLLHPLPVREKPNGRWSLVAGRRRLTAAKMLGWTEIDVHVTSGSASIEIPALAENLKRASLSPLEEAEAVALLYNERGLSIRDIAAQTGHGHSWVQDRLAVAALPPNFQDALHHKYISISAALLFQEIGDVEYRDYLLHVAKTNGATIHQVQAWVADWNVRKALIASPNADGTVPQPPPLPPPPRQPCFFCQENVDATTAILIRACETCFRTMRQLNVGPDPTGNGHELGASETSGPQQTRL